MSTARERAAVVLRRLGVDIATATRPGHGESNDVWIAGEVVLRMSGNPAGMICLLREARLGRILPREAGYPRVLGSGVQDGHEWMATARVPGVPLIEAWTGLDEPTRRRAVADLWERLEAVHRLQPDRARAIGCVGTPFYALRRADAARQLDRAREFLDTTEYAALGELLDVGFAALQAGPDQFAHTDAGPGNVLWNGSAAVPIDFEFACAGPAEMDVENLIRSFEEPAWPWILAAVGPYLARSRSRERLACLAILRDLWALGKWLDRCPRPFDIDTWEPWLALREHARRASWPWTL